MLKKLTLSMRGCVNKNCNGSLLMQLFIILSFMAPELSFSQSALEEIVVTVQRREQTLKEVPVSVTALDGALIERLGINDAQSYLSAVPNVSFDEGLRRGSRSLRMQIRGVGNLNPTAQAIAANSIGYYLDDVSIGFVVNGTVNPPLHDMERIEVLRGPQGTFFGLNAAAGALNMTSKRPNSDPLLKVFGEFGNDDKWSTAAIANYPISDTLMIRAVASIEQTAAVVKNINPVGGDSSSDNQYFKFSARWLATDKLTVDAIYSFSEEEQDILEMVPTGRLGQFVGAFAPGAGQPFLGTTPFNDPGVGFWPNNQSRRSVAVGCDGDPALRCDEGIRNEGDFFAGHLTYEADGYTAKAIVGYTETENDMTFDLDGSSVNALEFPTSSWSEVWSGEFRLSSNGDGPYEWILGGFYLDASQRFRKAPTADIDGVYLPFGTLPGGFVINSLYNGVDLENWGIFGDITWHVSDRLSLTAGARYVHDRFNEVTIMQTSFGGLQQPQDLVNTSDDVTPRIAVTFDWTDEITTYATISRGYKPGGVAGQWRSATPAEAAATGYASVAGNPQFYDKETIWNYEVGLRADLFDNKLRMNLSAFKMRWENFQSRISRFDLANQVTNVIEIVNAGDADTAGIEFDFVAAPSDRVAIGGAVGYLDSEFRSFKAAFPESVGPIDLSGESLPGAPEWTISFWGEYRMPLADLNFLPGGETEGYLRLQWRYRDETVSEFDGFSYLGTGRPSLVVDSFDVTDLYIGIENEKITISAYVENLLEEDYHYGGQIDTTYFGGINVRPHPRQWGVKFSYSFF